MLTQIIQYLPFCTEIICGLVAGVSLSVRSGPDPGLKSYKCVRPILICHLQYKPVRTGFGCESANLT